MRRLAALGAAVLVLAGCGGGSPAVQGTVTDGLITARADCAAKGVTEQVALTNAAGTVIARDTVPFTWSSGACVLPFSFSGVPSLAGYGIRVVGLQDGTTWLTPAQAGRFIHLRIGPGFTVTGS